MALNESVIPEREMFRGVIMYRKMREELEKVESMNTRHDDVWVCSFPRSGTTMTQELVYLILTLDFNSAKTVSQKERFPQLLEHADVNICKELSGLDYHERRKSPRMIKSHLHYFLLPEQIRNGKGKIIYICRNPKDVVVSYYRFMDYAKILEEEFSTLDDFVDCFVKGDMVDVIRCIAKFLERHLTEEDIQKIAQNCYVDSMRSNPMVNWDYWQGIRDLNLDSNSAFINKGKPGVWRDYLTQEQSKKIDSMLEEMGLFGLNFKHSS